jgi:hypothetical protein
MTTITPQWLFFGYGRHMWWVKDFRRLLSFLRLRRDCYIQSWAFLTHSPAESHVCVHDIYLRHQTWWWMDITSAKLYIWGGSRTESICACLV